MPTADRLQATGKRPGVTLESPAMEICHPHNLTRERTESKPYGIRVSLPAGDTFTHLLGADWEQFHWFSASTERDRALADMASEHLYSRRGDRPRLVFEAVDAPKRSDSD